jgi:acetolactate synthase-1/2/3 large subunit
MLEKYGVELVFGIPGVHTLELYRGLGDSPMRHITPRHEQGAGFMADGYARACGRPAVCFVITGPGLTNIATPMAQARQDSVPMLVISSVGKSHQLGMGEGRLHELSSQRNLAAEISVFSHTVLRADELPKVFARAFGVFSCQRPGPVHIEIPIDVLGAPADHVDIEPWALPSPPAAADEAVGRAVAMLREAERPLIIVGGGAISAGSEVRRVAEVVGAPVLNTVSAKGVLPYSHPLSVGGSASCAPVRDALREADVVLAVGTEFGETDYDFFSTGDAAIGGKLIRIDIDPAQLGRNSRPTLAICSDARMALEALSTALARGSVIPKEGVRWAGELRDSLKSGRDKRYGAFFAALDRALPDAIIAGDSAQPTYYAWLHYESESPRRYFHSASGYGTLGYAIPAAIGAKLARSDQPVVGLIGDGAAQFTVAEIASAVEAQVSVIFIVWNNQGYGEIRTFFEKSDVAKIGVDLHTPDFVALAQGFGCSACRVTELDDLESALRRAAKAPGPTLIEVDQSDFVDGDAVS